MGFQIESSTIQISIRPILIVDFGPIRISKVISNRRLRSQSEFDLNLIKVNWFQTFFDHFWLKDQKWSSECQLFNWKWSNLIENVKINQKFNRFQTFLIYFWLKLIDFKLFDLFLAAGINFIATIWIWTTNSDKKVNKNDN